MDNLWFVSSILAAVLALVLAYVWAPSRSLRSRVNARLQHQSLTHDDSEAEGAIFAGLVYGLVSLGFVSGDFKELEAQLDATGKSPLQARQHYLLLCWVLPILITLALFATADLLYVIIGFVGSFYMSRKAIRSSGRAAENQQNRESIELCQLTRMLMQAGLSPERSLKLISHQARSLMPLLITRIDRFNRVMESGADRTRALDELGRNRNLNVLKSYVTLMKQAGSLGSGVSEGLDQIVIEAHSEERAKLKEETNRIGAKMTIIMMLFMLPALFILIGGPAVLSIMDAF